ncbi:O-antigen ligase family protein [Marinivivus vitaminiproducens]|uniref:O-antigen ligase family protein n=1 Tax=Marinivivus vitaminiproducens TaxID=3035935 RepID=UPI00279BD664|nr:O-antigen ligase family protein [Geminicoccaceae bacterium SCSIO 64248]
MIANDRALRTHAPHRASGPLLPVEFHSVSGRVAARLAEAAFFLVVLYTLCVLRPDFTPEDFGDMRLSVQLEDTSASDIVNQLFWLAIAGLSAAAVALNPRPFMDAFRRNHLLFALGLLCVISAVWAFAPGIAFRRSILQIMILFTLVVTLNYGQSVERLHKIAYLAFGIAALANLAALPFGFAFDWRHLFRGIVGDKNVLGAMAVAALFVGVSARFYFASVFGRLVNAAYLLAWLGIAVLAGSKTSLALIVLVPAVVLGVDFVARVARVGFGSLLGVALLLTGVILLAFASGPGVGVDDLIAAVMPDATFTGRTAIWSFALDETLGHLPLGYGYQSFWNIGFNAPNLKAQDQFIHFLNQSHNGYLDVALQLGLPGLALTGIVLYAALNLVGRTRRAGRAAFWLVGFLVVFALLHNLTESSLLRAYHPTWIAFLFAAVIGDRIRAELRRGGPAPAGY